MTAEGPPYKGHLDLGQLSNEDNAYCPSYISRDVYCICIANRAMFCVLFLQIECVEVDDEEGGEIGGIHGYTAPPTASHMIRGKDDAELGLHGNSVGAFRLYTYNEVPPFLKGNPFITHGYRLYLPTGVCFKR